MGLLLIRAMTNQNRAAHADAHRRKRRGARGGQLTSKDKSLRDTPTATAKFGRPGGSDPAAPVKDTLPRHARFIIGINTRHRASRLAQIRRQFGCDESAHVVAKSEVGGAPTYIHQAAPGEEPRSCGEDAAERKVLKYFGQRTQLPI